MDEEEVGIVVGVVGGGQGERSPDAKQAPSNRLHRPRNYELGLFVRHVANCDKGVHRCA
jgi:hypothetical protein